MALPLNNSHALFGRLCLSNRKASIKELESNTEQSIEGPFFNHSFTDFASIMFHLPKTNTYLIIRHTQFVVVVAATLGIVLNSFKVFLYNTTT